MDKRGPFRLCGTNTYYGSGELDDGRKVMVIGGKMDFLGFPVIHNEKGTAIVSEERDYFEFRINGKLHREGGLPALIDKTFYHKEYWENGKLHRLGGPAIEHGLVGHANYFIAYYIDGMLHRTSGPAYIERVLGVNGGEIFAVANKIVTECQFMLETMKLDQSSLDKIVPAIKTNKDLRLVKNAMKKLGYSKKDANRFEERIQLLKALVR